MASILKAPRPEGVVHHVELAARERARALVAEAEAEAARIRQQAEDERREALLAAARAGREEGLAAAAAAQLRAAEVRQRRLEAAEREIAAVALEVARKLVGQALADRPELVRDLARRALEPVRARREVLLRVNPSDAPLLRSEQPRLQELLDRAPEICLREDAGIERGGVIVETEAGRVDARVEAQLAVLERTLVEPS